MQAPSKYHPIHIIVTAHAVESISERDEGLAASFRLTIAPYCTCLKP
jgi:hypothetical protein